MSLWLLKMDPSSLNVLVGLVSAVTMMTAVIYTLTYILGAFSSRSGTMSLRFLLGSVFYFFGLTIFFVMGTEWLSRLAHVPVDGIPSYLSIGASTLAINALLHIACGLLTILMYVKGQVSLSLTLRRVSNSIRKRRQSKSEQ